MSSPNQSHTLLDMIQLFQTACESLADKALEDQDSVEASVEHDQAGTLA